MFGYVRPQKSELKVKEFELFKAQYCALCHVLGKQYGIASRFILNYDFVFLSLLLQEDTQCPKFQYCRCIVSPFRKKLCLASNDKIKKCAAMSVILTWWKLKDSILDKKWFSGIPARLGLLFLHRAYKKASADEPGYVSTVRECLTKLLRFEKQGETSLDKVADQFAILLREAISVEDTDLKRPLQQLMYHTGRWIYLLDAYDDLKKDAAAGLYNPLLAHFNSGEAILSPDDSEAVRLTLQHSLNLIGNAFALLPTTVWTPILQNIIYLGMPSVMSQVFEGVWPNKRDKLPKNDWRLI